MPEPEKTSPVGTFLMVLGAGLILIAAIDLVLAVAGDNPLRYDWLFFVGLVVMVVGRRLRPRPEEDEGPSYVDCPACGAINDRGAATCGQCDAEIT